MVVREGLVLTLSGLAIGVPLALFAVRALRTLMFGVSETDPVTFGAVAALFVVMGLASGIVPARRATRVDPLVALRSE